MSRKEVFIPLEIVDGYPLELTGPPEEDAGIVLRQLGLIASIMRNAQNSEQYHGDPNRLATWIERSDSKFGYALGVSSPYPETGVALNALYYTIDRDIQAERKIVGSPKNISVAYSDRVDPVNAERVAQAFDSSELSIINALAYKLQDAHRNRPVINDPLLRNSIMEYHLPDLASHYPTELANNEEMNEHIYSRSEDIERAARWAIRKHGQRKVRTEMIPLQHAADTVTYNLRLRCSGRGQRQLIAMDILRESDADNKQFLHYVPGSENEVDDDQLDIFTDVEGILETLYYGERTPDGLFEAVLNFDAVSTRRRSITSEIDALLPPSDD